MRIHLARFGACLVLIAAVALMAGGLWQSPLLLTGLYTIMAVLLLARWHSENDVGFFVMPMILGPSAEAVAINGGAWSYTGVEVIPLWLPLAWGLAGFAIRRATVATIGMVRELRGAAAKPAEAEG